MGAHSIDKTPPSCRPIRQKGKTAPAGTFNTQLSSAGEQANEELGRSAEPEAGTERAYQRQGSCPAWGDAESGPASGRKAGQWRGGGVNKNLCQLSSRVSRVAWLDLVTISGLLRKETTRRIGLN